MTTYGGFDPGTFQPWALNLAQNALGTAGVARGLVVAPATPATMNVVVGVDAIQGDGICFLPNGGWLRIDAAATLSVPANSSGSSRTDAVVAFVDPTGVGGAPALQYVTGWTTGFKGQNNNQLVLALVTVPNGASSVVAANLANTPLQASVGAASPDTLDSVVSDNTPGAQQARIFSQYNVVVAPSAGNGQTTFAVPLTGMQRLVPMGRIGGADEVGYFSGPGGWYVPKLFGSTSGPLSVKSVDYVGGNLVAASGAVAGEQVVASFKFYDFSRDLAVWTGTTLLPRNSPYLVYQGDVHASGTHLTSDVWDGTLNAYTPVTPGMSVVLTYFGNTVYPHTAPTASGQQYSVSLDGGGATTFTLAYSADVGPVGTFTTHGPASGVDGIHQLTLTYVTGLFDIAGFDVCCNLSGVYVDGGIAVVDGFTVNVGNTSLSLNPPSQGYASVLYVDRYGNVTASSRTQAFPIGEALGLRIPLAQAVQYVRPTGTTTMYGTYAAVGTPKGLPAVVALGNYNAGNSILGSGPVGNSWKLAQDPTSPTGGVWQTSASQDGLVVGAPMTGLDLVMSLTSTAGFNVSVDNVTSYRVVAAGVPAGQRVRLTCATAWPVGNHAVRVYVDSTYGGVTWGPEFAEVRYPELPPPPPQTLPLAGLLSDGAGTLGSYGTMAIVKDMLHDAQFVGGAGTFQVVNDLFHLPSAGPMVRVANTSTNQSWVQTIHTSGAFRVHYEGTPNTGIFNVVVDSVSTYGTVDTAVGGWNGNATTPIYYIPSGVHTVSCQATATKGSGSGLFFVLQGIEYVPPANLAIDATRFGPDGIRPSIRGSALLGQKGDQLFDAGPGVGTLHLQDRAVSSRKFAPTWNRQVAAQTWSAAPGIYPFLAAGVLVETPSVLLCQLNGNMRWSGAAGGYAAAAFVLDGVQNVSPGASGSQGYWDSLVAGKMFNFNLSELLVVGPGSHTVQAYIGGGAPYPYVDGTLPLTLTVVAVAL